jgi:tetratricopeptide (TPR) repeat protein
MLTTALFHQDIPMLYKFHFFIKDLHMQLEQLHNLYKSSLESRIFTVYCGLNMPMKIFDETIRQEVNNLLSFDTFLSTSLNKDIALQFAQKKSNNDNESILFHIEIDTNKLQRPFADISHLSAVECNDEILFSIGTVFRINHVAKEKTSDGIWFVYLSSIDENNKQLKHEIKQTQITLLNFFKRVWQAQIKRGDRYQIATSYINMASMYYKQNEYQKSLDLYQKALENLLELSSPNPLTIATYQSNIAMVYTALEQQTEALKLYEKVFKIRIKHCEPNDPLLIDTLHTIGHIYCRKKEFDKALKQYYKALKIQSISFEPPLKQNPSSIAATHTNIALVYQQQNKPDHALDHFLKALDYQREYLSKYHPILGFLYNNIGTIYYQLKQFDLALKNQLLALQIEEHSLPKDHKTLTITYTNIATSYEQLQKYDQAINYAQKAVNQLKLHRSKDNSDIQTKQAYLDRLLRDKHIFQDK